MVYFWTDAVKDKASNQWYWETTFNLIADEDFHWGYQQPDLQAMIRPSCINFSNRFGGYDDEDCLNYQLGAICQEYDIL
jgi:hypothetical protein